LMVEGMDGTVAERRWAVFVSRRLPAPAMDLIAERCELAVHEGPGPIPRERLLLRLPGVAGVLSAMTERVDDEFLAAGESLVVVANFGVGYDNIDVPACTRRGVLVTNTPDVLTESTADIAWVLMMAAARRVGEGERFLRSRSQWVWEPDFMLGRDFSGKTLGIVGFGRIGQAVAKRAGPFRMRILYNSSSRASADVEAELEAEYRELDDLFAEADFVTLHTPLTPQTRHLVDARRLKLMKSTAVLVNASRGPVVDEAALVEALHAGRIFAAGLDVFEREPEVHPGLLELESVVIIPHLGSATVQTRTAMAMLAAENLIAAVSGERPPNLVNPEAWDRRA
jgi:glyoxylate reductase